MGAPTKAHYEYDVLPFCQSDRQGCSCKILALHYGTASSLERAISEGRGCFAWLKPRFLWASDHFSDNDSMILHFELHDVSRRSKRGLYLTRIAIWIFLANIIRPHDYGSLSMTSSVCPAINPSSEYQVMECFAHTLDLSISPGIRHRNPSRNSCHQHQRRRPPNHPIQSINPYFIPFPFASVSPNSLKNTFTTPSPSPSLPSSKPGLIPTAKYFPSALKLNAATLAAYL